MPLLYGANRAHDSIAIFAVGDLKRRPLRGGGDRNRLKAAHRDLIPRRPRMRGREAAQARPQARRTGSSGRVVISRNSKNPAVFAAGL